MSRIRVEYRGEDRAYFHGTRIATESVHGNLTFNFQGPFHRRRKFISDDHHIYALIKETESSFDPESGRSLGGTYGEWRKVGRVVKFLRGDVYFIGEDDVPCLWEKRGYPKRVEKWPMSEDFIEALAAELSLLDGEVFTTKNGKIIIEMPFQDEAQARSCLRKLLKSAKMIEFLEEEKEDDGLLY